MNIDHQVPPEVSEALLRRGGRNRFGEPNYRCVWSDTRLELSGGEWSDYKDNNYKSGVLIRRNVEVRNVPKYWNKPHRWIIERWIPPEQFGSPLLWEANTVVWMNGKKVEQLGPFPTRGDYDCCFVCEDDKEEFIPVTVRLATVVVDLVEASRRLSTAERKVGLQEMIERAEKLQDARYEEILSDSEPFDAKPNNLNPVPVLQLKQEHLRRERE